MRSNNLQWVRSAKAFLATVLFLSVGNAPAAQHLRYHITAIGELGANRFMRPVTLNNHGAVVGEARGSNGVSRPFVYQNGVMRELAIGDGAFSTGIALDINDAGAIVAQATVTNHDHGYLVTDTGTIDLNAQTGLRIYPNAINQNGLVVGFTPQGFNAMAISWSNGVLRALGELETGAGSIAYDVNRWGEIVGQAAPDWGAFSVLFQNGQLNIIPGIAGMYINDRGDIAGDLRGSIHAALYRNGTVLDLGTLGGDIRSWAHGMNNYGDVVGHSEDGAENPRAFVYVEGVLHDLNTLVGPRTGWSFVVANGINDRGQVVGVGLYQGQEQGFLLTPIGQGRRK